jgi:Tfp pilus assembly PilM family ATPase
MKKVADLIKVFQRGYTDVLGLDVAGSGLKAVRLKVINQAITVMAVDIFPPDGSAVEGSIPVGAQQLPKDLRARHVALATSESGAVVKLLTFPAHSDKPAETHVNELMGLGDQTEYRLAYEHVTESRSEIRALAVRMPLSTVTALCQLFPAGSPAPCAIEVSGLASMTAYLKGPGLSHLEDCIAVIDFGANVTLVAFFNRGTMVLIRKFEMGTNTILKKLQDNLGVDGDVALGILNDGSFDITQIVHQAMEAFLQQLIISWDFVERRENCRISRLYACGGGASLGSWAHEVLSTTGQSPTLWNPFEGLAMISDTLLDKWKGQESRFSAAVGSALGMFDEK